MGNLQATADAELTLNLLKALQKGGIRRVEIDEAGVHWHPRNPTTANVFANAVLSFGADLATALKRCHWEAYRRPHGLAHGRYDLTTPGAIVAQALENVTN